MNENKPLPKGWEVKNLGEVCEIFNGSTPLKRKKEYWENGTINWFTISDIRKQGRVIKFTNQRVTKKGFESTSLKILPVNSILLCCTASIGEFAITRIELTTNQQFNGLVVKNNKQLLPEYLFYFSSILKKTLLNVSGRATIDFVSMTKVRNIQIPLPPLSEQKCIVAILDKTFVEITKAEAIAKTNLQNAKELFESYLNNVFENKGDDWEEKTLGEVIEIRSGRNQKEVLNPNGKYPILGSAGKVMGYADKFLCVSGTTIIGRKGTINKPLFIKTNFWNVDTAFGLIASDKLTNEFLYYFCRSFNFKELDKGTTLPSLVKKDLIKITISFPKLKNEQKQIVQKLEQLQSQVKKLEVIYQQKIIDLSELKKSILQKAFNGELKMKKNLNYQ